LAAPLARAGRRVLVLDRMRFPSDQLSTHVLMPAGTSELAKLGARMSVEGRSSIITGPSHLHGARVTVPDIRSGAALVIAGLCADGTTELDNVFHLERGYDDLEMKLAGLGADIERLTTDEPGTEVRDLTGVVGD